MLILSELIVPFIGGVLRVLEALLLLASGVVVTSPEVTGPVHAASRSAFVRLLTWPVRAAIAHPRRLAVVLVVAAAVACVVALARP